MRVIMRHQDFPHQYFFFDHCLDKLTIYYILQSSNTSDLFQTLVAARKRNNDEVRNKDKDKGKCGFVVV